MARIPYLTSDDLDIEERPLLDRPIHINRALANSPGALEANRLYVLLPGSPVPVTAGRRLVVLDGTRVILPVGAVRHGGNWGDLPWSNTRSFGITGP